MNSGLTNPSVSSLGYYIAGLSLPHGAKINKMTLYYYDNSTRDLSLYLYLETADNSSLLMRSLYSSVAVNAFRNVSSITIDNPIVDNQVCGYYLFLTIPENASLNLMLTNVRIDYEYTSNLPLVTK